ncbi:hypothetical protein F4604DRAFT_669335 [Suillus subluteus]|nr:hypothetical protein F4604DRAFT_669335 [Suillus subluteus]
MMCQSRLVHNLVPSLRFFLSLISLNFPGLCFLFAFRHARANHVERVVMNHGAVGLSYLIMFLIDYEGGTQVLGPAGHVLARQTSDKASASSVLQGSPMLRCFLLAPLLTGDSRVRRPNSLPCFLPSVVHMHRVNSALQQYLT